MPKFCPKKSCTYFELTNNKITKNGTYLVKSSEEKRQLFYCHGEEHSFDEMAYSGLVKKKGSNKDSILAVYNQNAATHHVYAEVTEVRSSDRTTRSKIALKSKQTEPVLGIFSSQMDRSTPTPYPKSIKLSSVFFHSSRTSRRLSAIVISGKSHLM